MTVTEKNQGDIDAEMRAAHQCLAPAIARKPDGWATIVRGRVANVSMIKPRSPGEAGWDYWKDRGHQAPLPVYVGFADLSNAEVAGLVERRRQVEQEGYTPEHDDMYTAGELPRAAACYALVAAGVAVLRTLPFWPWARQYLKTADSDRCLDKAIALLIAEKERRERASVSQRKQVCQQES